MKLFALALAALLPSLASAADVDKNKTMGNPTAPITFELYSDFMCPHCKALHENILPSIILDFVKTGKAYLIFREFPLNNPAFIYSRQVAALAVAAGRVGKYEAVNDALFKSQQSWSMSGKYWDFAAAVLTPDEQKKVMSLMRDPAVLAEVQSDVKRGEAVPVTQTPTMVVTYKGKSQAWAQWADYGLFRSYVNDLLKK